MATQIGGFTMEWNKIIQIKKFIPLQEVFNRFGTPKFKLGERPIYYIGNGLLASYTNKKFRIENSSRIEYGDEGEYILSIYFFMKKKELEDYFKLKEEKYDFEGDILGISFKIMDGVEINSTFDQVTELLRLIPNSEYYQEGETRAFRDGVFEFQNKYVIWRDFTFLFFGKNKKTPLSAFELTLKE